jgi:transcriptional regulator with XRE-family HTH domain
MPRRSIAVSRAAADALGVLANQIKMARVSHGWTLADMAARVGVTSRTMAAVESGSPSVAVGTVFNAAFTVGVDLFGLDGAELARARRRGEETLALLPSRVRKPIVRDNPDDFDF